MFFIFAGELSLKELAILGSRYGKGEITLKQGEAVTWSRPKQDVKNILQQLWKRRFHFRASAHGTSFFRSIRIEVAGIVYNDSNTCSTKKEASCHPAIRAFLKLRERKERLCRNRVKSLLSMRLLLLGNNLNECTTSCLGHVGIWQVSANCIPTGTWF